VVVEVAVDVEVVVEVVIELIVVGEVTVVVRLTKIVVVDLSDVELVVLLDVTADTVPYAKSVVPLVDVVPFAQITVAEYVPLTQDDSTAVKLALSVLAIGLRVMLEVRICRPLGLRTLIVACAEVIHAAEMTPLT